MPRVAWCLASLSFFPLVGSWSLLSAFLPFLVPFSLSLPLPSVFFVSVVLFGFVSSVSALLLPSPAPLPCFPISPPPLPLGSQRCKHLPNFCGLLASPLPGRLGFRPARRTVDQPRNRSPWCLVSQGLEGRVGHFWAFAYCLRRLASRGREGRVGHFWAFAYLLQPVLLLPCKR